MMHLSLMFDARARQGPGSRSRKKTPSKSTINRIRRARGKLEEAFHRGVDVQTAGDEYVCIVCEDISEGGPYDIDTAEGLIPAHAWCRCAFVPAGTLQDAFDPDQPRDPHGRWSNTQSAYHGTTREIGRFSELGSPDESFMPDRMLGYHFAKDPAVANAFAMERFNEAEHEAKSGGRIIPVTIPSDEHMLQVTQPKYEWANNDRPTNRNIETDEVAIAKMIAREAYPSHPDILAKFLEQRAMKPEEAASAAKIIASGGTANLPIDGPHDLDRLVNNFLGAYPYDVSMKRQLVNTARENWQKQGYKGLKYINTSPMETMPTAGVSDPTSYIVFDPKHVRGRYTGDFNIHHAPAGSPEGGQFTSGEGGGATAEAKPEVKLDERVIDVGGDQWNKDLAVKLERQYEEVKPELEKILTNMLPEHRSEDLTPETDEWEGPFIPEEWDQMSNDAQDAVKDAWMEHTKSEFYDSEVNEWYESGQALDQSKQHLADSWWMKTFEQTAKGPVEHYEIPEWAQGVFDEVRNEHRIPYSDEQLYKAIDMHYENDYEGHNAPEIDFDDNKLKEPQFGYDPSEELPLGLPKLQPENLLTQDMRNALENGLVKAFNKEAEDNAYKEEPPEGYFDDSVKDSQETIFEEMSDHQKYDWAKDHWDDFPKDEDNPAGPEKLTAIPHFDPIGDRGDDKQYRLTKIAGTNMSRERAADLMVKRGVFENRSDALKAAIQLDAKVWTDWKSSSSSPTGKMLQNATAAELGGRYRKGDPEDLERERANKWLAYQGGWDGLRAYVRAKWETTQYLLDKANMPVLDVYRAISISSLVHSKEMNIGGFNKLTDFKLERNGAQSTSATPSVANNWDGSTHRVVLRALVPRTAVLSVPAYGQNIYGEKEVVVAGTAWKKWDAWRGRAPDLDEVPINDKNRFV
jgi:Arc/MetJ-type ribon-helix-helix transcriptional regulator